MSYGDDVDKVRKVLEGVLASDGRILKDPAPTIAVLELAESSFCLQILVRKTRILPSISIDS